MGTNAPDCHAAKAVEFAIEACLDLWAERISPGRDRIPGTGAEATLAESAAPEVAAKSAAKEEKGGFGNVLVDLCFMIASLALAAVIAPFLIAFLLFLAVIQRTVAVVTTENSGDQEPLLPVEDS